MRICILLSFILLIFFSSYVYPAIIVKQFPVSFDSPYAITIDDTGNYMWIGNFQGDIYKVSLSDSSLGQIVDHFTPFPVVKPIGGMVYDKANNLLIVTLASSPSVSGMYNIHLDTHLSELRFDISFGWPNGSAWDGSNIWVSHSDAYDRTLYLLNGVTGQVLGTIGVQSKYPTGVAYDQIYLYNLASVDGYVYRYNRQSGLRADGNGFPLPPVFTLNPTDAYAGNLVMYGTKMFWQSCAANRRIYLIDFTVNTDVSTTSVGMIRSLLK